MRMLADDGYALAFVGVAQMRQDDATFREPHGHRVQMARQCAVQRSLRNEGGSRMKQHRQFVRLGVGPQRIKLPVLRIKPAVHGHELDPAQPQFLVALSELVFPVGLGGIER
jgi:hypothetical protein